MAASDSTYLFHQQEVSLLTTISPGEGCAFSEAPWYVADAHTLRVDGIQGVGQPYVLATMPWWACCCWPSSWV